jgi:hypothetical protein
VGAGRLLVAGPRALAGGELLGPIGRLALRRAARSVILPVVPGERISGDLRAPQRRRHASQHPATHLGFSLRARYRVFTGRNALTPWSPKPQAGQVSDRPVGSVRAHVPSVRRAKPPGAQNRLYKAISALRFRTPRTHRLHFGQLAAKFPEFRRLQGLFVASCLRKGAKPAPQFAGDWYPAYAQRSRGCVRCVRSTCRGRLRRSGRVGVAIPDRTEIAMLVSVLALRMARNGSAIAPARLRPLARPFLRRRTPAKAGRFGQTHWDPTVTRHVEP